MKTFGLVGLFLLALLVVALFAGWQRERQRAANLTEECNRLSLELTSTRTERPDSPGENASTLPDVRPEISESNTSSQSEELIANVISNPATMIVEAKTNLLSNLVRERDAIHTTPTQELSSTNDEPPYTNLQLEIYRCCNQMGALTLAAERWAADHEGLIPENLMVLRGYSPPMLLVCPAVRPKNLSAEWEHFTSADVTYQILSSSNGKRWDFQIAGLGSPATVGWLRCPVHNLRALNRKMSIGIPSSQVFQPR